jgi:hypothetical protein
MRMQTSAKSSIWLFLIAFALTFYGLGASFVEGFINYPTWHLIGANEFRAFHQAVDPRVIGYLVMPKLVGSVLTVLLLWFRSAAIPRRAIWLAVALNIIVWISTIVIQIPIQLELSRSGLSIPLIERLLLTDLWLRQVPNIINALLFLWMMTLLLRENIKNNND